MKKIVLEEQVSGWMTALIGLAEWAFYGIFVGIFLLICYFIADYLTYTTKVVIKERVGEEFKFDPSIRLTKENKKLEKTIDQFKMALGQTASKEQKTTKPLKAIPTVTRNYRAKIVKVKGIYVLKLYRLIRRAIKLKVVGSVFWNFTGNSKKRIELLKLSNHIYAPLVTIMDEEAYNKAVHDETYINWVVNDIEEDNKKFNKQTFWERYGTFIMIAMTFMLCIIFVVVVFKNMQEFANAGKAGAEAMASAFKQGCVQNVG